MARQPAVAHEAILRRQDDGETWVPDAVLAVAFAPTWSATTHPIEDSSPTTDHIRPNPELIVISCVVTQNPTAPNFGGILHLEERLRWLRDS